MGWLTRLWKPAKREAEGFAVSRMVEEPSSGAGKISRKQLLLVVLRETLLRNGIPAPWIGMQFLRTIDREGSHTRGVHVRLLVRHWHPDLPACMVALERDFCRRVALIDYRTDEWLRGVSWQFELADDAGFPPLPRAGAWTAEPRSGVQRAVEKPSGADVIAGPVVISNGREGRDFHRETYSRTQPASL